MSRKNENRVYTIPELAEILDVSKRTIMHLLDRGEIKSFKSLRTRRVREKDFEAFLLKARVVAQDKAGK